MRPDRIPILPAIFAPFRQPRHAGTFLYFLGTPRRKDVKAVGKFFMRGATNVTQRSVGAFPQLPRIVKKGGKMEDTNTSSVYV